MNERSSITKLTLSFQGEAVSRHSMSVHDLAPVLSAWGDVFSRANELTHGSLASTDLRVTATRPGSFDIYCLVETVRLSMSFLSSDPITSAANVCQLVIGSIALLKHRMGKTTPYPQSSEQIESTLESLDIDRQGGIQADLSPENMKTLGPLLIQLAGDLPYRKSLSEGVRPLERYGFDRLDIWDEDRKLESIGKGDLLHLSSPRRDDIVRDFTSREVLKIVNAYLGERSGQWRLHDGRSVNRYSIRDSRFLREVRNGIRSFAAGDFLECETRHIQRITDAGAIRKEFEILTVVRHLPHNMNPELFLGD